MFCAMVGTFPEQRRFFCCWVACKGGLSLEFPAKEEQFSTANYGRRDHVRHRFSDSSKISSWNVVEVPLPVTWLQLVGI